jgi:hypothetical protein
LIIGAFYGKGWAAVSIFRFDARVTRTSRRLFLNNLAFNFDNLSLQPYYEELFRTGKFKPSKNNKG